MVPSRPVIITDAMQHWSALSKWCDVEYLRAKAGMRVVPIEVGKTYLAEGWTQKLITLSEFIDQFVLSSNSEKNVRLESP